MGYQWPNCKTLKDVPDFATLKKNTWMGVMEGMAKCVEETLGVDGGEMGRDLGKLGGSLEVLLGLVADFMGVYGEMKGAGGAVGFCGFGAVDVGFVEQGGECGGGGVAGAVLSCVGG